MSAQLLDSLTGGRLAAATAAARPLVSGQVTRVLGIHLEVSGIEAAIGDAVRIHAPIGAITAEVVAVNRSSLVCMPYGELHGVRVGTPASSAGGPLDVPVGRQRQLMQNGSFGPWKVAKYNLWRQKQYRLHRDKGWV